MTVNELVWELLKIDDRDKPIKVAVRGQIRPIRKINSCVDMDTNQTEYVIYGEEMERDLSHFFYGNNKKENNV